MFGEKKIKEYAERRLAAYADSQKSLERLQEAQRENRPTEEKSGRHTALFRRVAFSLSAVIVVVITVLLFVVGLPLGGAAPEEDAKNALPGALRDKATMPHYSDSYNSEDAIIAPLTADAVNKETTYVRVCLSDDVSVFVTYTDDGHYYCFDVEQGDVAFRGVVLFGTADEADFSFDGTSERTVAGQTFSYETTGENVLRGKILTDSERIYVLDCAGGTTEERLSVIKSVFVQK